MDKLLDIQSRLNSGAYNPTNYKKNAKFLQDKIAFMANREAQGQLRGKMGNAYALSQALLPRVEEYRPEGAAAPRVMKPKVRAAAAVREAPVVAAAPGGGAAAEPTLAAFNVPAMNAAPMGLRIKAPGKTRKSPKKSPGTKRKTPVNKPKATRTKKRNLAEAAGGEGYWYNKPYPAMRKPKVAKAAGKTKRVQVESPLLAMDGNDYNRRIPRSPDNQFENEYLVEAAGQYLPMLPELYDPFTGRKFGPENNPLPPVEKAYIMLKKLRQKTYKRAATLRKAAGKVPAVPEAASALRANAGEL